MQINTSSITSQHNHGSNSSHTTKATHNLHLAEQEPDGRVAVRCYPDAGKVVVVDSVLEKLSAAVLMNVDATSQSIVDVALHHGRICSGLHLKTSDTVVVDVVAVEVALRQRYEKTVRLSTLCGSIMLLLFLLLSPSSSSSSYNYCRTVQF